MFGTAPMPITTSCAGSSVPSEVTAAAALPDPVIARLSGGPFGTVASYLPAAAWWGCGCRSTDSDPVQIAVVARMGVPLPRLADELGAAVVEVLGPVAVDVTVAHVETAEAAATGLTRAEFVKVQSAWEPIEEYREVKSTVERLSPTRVRINVEVPFDELKPISTAPTRRSPSRSTCPASARARCPPASSRPASAAAWCWRGRQRRHPDEVLRGRHVGRGRAPLGQPEIEVTEIADNERLAFTAEVDVRPEITLPELVVARGRGRRGGGHRRRRRRGAGQPARPVRHPTGVERPAAKDDFVQIDLAASVDGEAVEEAQTSGLSYQVGQGGLIDGIDDAITGLSAGESATFPTTLVAGEYKDREAEVTVTVTAVKERELPDADDEFAQLASEFDTLEELTADLRTRLGRVRQMEQLTEARDKVLDALVDATEVPLPEGILKQEIDSRVHDAVHPFDHDEAKFAEFLEENGKTREEFDTEAREDAEKSVRVRLVLDKLADDQEVTVSQEELTERIVFQAQQYQMPPEEFVQRIQEAGQLGAIYADVRRSKALIAAVRAATVTDASGTALDMAELLGDDEPEQADEAPEESAEKSDETTVDA